MKLLLKLYNFLPRKYQFKLYFYYFTTLLTNLLDVVGIGLFFPAINFLINKKSGVSFLDNFINSMNFTQNEIITYLLITIIIVFLIKNFLIIYINIFQTRFNLELGYDLSRMLFNQYLFMPIGYHSSNNSSKLLRNTSDEVFIFVKYVSNSVLLIFTDLTLLFIFSALLIYFSSTFIIFILIIFIILALVIYHLSKNKIKNYGNIRLNISENILRFLREGFSSIREIKIYNLREYFVARYSEESKKVIPLSVFINLISALPKVIFEMFAVIFFISLVFYSLTIEENFEKIIPTLSIFVLSIYKLVPSVIRILQSFQKIKHYIPSFYNLNYVFESHKGLLEQDNENNININNFNFESLEIKNVFFSYKKNENILEDVNIKIRKNSKILLKGKSGSGKSTLLDILCGLQEPKKGEIYINGINAKEIDKKKLLSKISYVSQAPILMDSDLITNIALGKDKNYNLDKILTILKIVQLEDFFLKTTKKIGEKGSLISGGQKQRISIARALYFEPQILILDEATNSIDYETEMKIIKNIISWYPDLAIIKVSHSQNNYEDLFEKFYLKNKKLLK